MKKIILILLALSIVGYLSLATFALETKENIKYKSQEEINFSTENVGATNDVNIANNIKSATSLPKTGESSQLPLLIGGVIIIIIGIVTFIILKKKGK